MCVAMSLNALLLLFVVDAVDQLQSQLIHHGYMLRPPYSLYSKP
jgi:hypothetical protein